MVAAIALKRKCHARKYGKKESNCGSRQIKKTNKNTKILTNKIAIDEYLNKILRFLNAGRE
jgi:hypothetical protein